MVKETELYLKLIQDEFDNRRLKNRLYSLRAYARDIGVNSSSLSAILKGKRNLPDHKALGVAQSLKLDPKITLEFVESVNRSKIALSKLKRGEIKQKDIENPKVLELLKSQDAMMVLALVGQRREDTLELISKRMDLEKEEILSYLEDLDSYGFVEKNSEGHYKLSDDSLARVFRRSSFGIERATQNVHGCIDRLPNLTREESYFKEYVIGGNPSQKEGAKKLIEDFFTKLSTYIQSKSSEQKRLYQLNLQFLPSSDESVDPPENAKHS